MRVELSDELVDQLRTCDPRVPPEETALRLLAHYAQVPLTERVILVRAPEREQLERLLGGGSLLDGADLLRKVDRRCGVTIGNVRVKFTTGELEQIERRAKANGVSTQDECNRIVQGLKSQFFTLGIRP